MQGGATTSVLTSPREKRAIQPFSAVVVSKTKNPSRLGFYILLEERHPVSDWGTGAPRISGL